MLRRSESAVLSAFACSLASSFAFRALSFRSSVLCDRSRMGARAQQKGESNEGPKERRRRVRTPFHAPSNLFCSLWRRVLIWADSLRRWFERASATWHLSWYSRTWACSQGEVGRGDGKGRCEGEVGRGGVKGKGSYGLCCAVLLLCCSHLQLLERRVVRHLGLRHHLVSCLLLRRLQPAAAAHTQCIL